MNSEAAVDPRMLAAVAVKIVKAKGQGDVDESQGQYLMKVHGARVQRSGAEEGEQKVSRRISTMAHWDKGERTLIVHNRRVFFDQCAKLKGDSGSALRRKHNGGTESILWVLNTMTPNRLRFDARDLHFRTPGFT